MSKKYIPIIGTISAGKSTFLRAFLGIDMLQIGATTTSKFVCLIKHSNTTSFYHVIPTLEKSIEFIKEGEEIKDLNEIKNKIIEINETLSNKKPIKKEDLFYILEIPIKNINNSQLLENCYFMDIPGLNENDTTYINDIFSLIKENDILFEIMVFDSTSIGSDNILNIFKDLEKKNCLKKQNNLYILNKIDQCTKGGEGDIIDYFKNYFYKEFEDEKKIDKIVINFSENYFIPMNSLLYDAESKINEDFYSLLLFELFSYSEYNNKSEFENFFEFIQKRIETIIVHNNIDSEEIEKLAKKIKDDNSPEIEIITQSIEKIKKNVQTIKANSDIQLGIKLEKKNVKIAFKKLFLIQKKHYYNCVHSDSYNQIQYFVSNIILNKNDLLTPSSANLLFDKTNNDFLLFSKIYNNESNKKITELKKNDKKLNSNNLKTSIEILDNLDNFIKETFKLIDYNNELKEFRTSLDTLRENLLGRKIRISLIGNINVGKSTVLNCIIGENILPAKETECTYRGVIIRNKNIDNYELYRTKLITKGKGLDKYYFFEDAKKPYTKGLNNVKSYLNNKNNDKQITDDDAYIVIVGKLKIFDFIKVDEKLKEKIEFVDLPGPDRKDNVFNENRYYEKILKFSNCCVYINEPKTINDQNSNDRMIEQYKSDKNKIVVNLRPNYIKTCLFLINKADTLESDNDKQKIINALIKNIPEKVSLENINISFFSAKSFMEYLDYYNKYVILMEKEPLYSIFYLYKEWNSSLINPKKFKNYILGKISDKIEEKFNLEFDEDSEEQINIPESFNKNMKSALDDLSKMNKLNLSNNEDEEIINRLYLIYYKLKNKNVYETIYSPAFFDKLKEVILFSEKLQNQNLNNSLNTFFSYADELFNKEIEKKGEKEKEETTEKFEFIKNIVIPKVDEFFKEKIEKMKDVIELTKFQCTEIYNDELKNIDDRLKEVDKDVEKAAKLLEEKITKKIEEMEKKMENEKKSFITDIENLLKECINKFYENKDISLSSIDTNKGLTFKMVVSLLTSTVSGIAVRAGLTVLGESILVNTASGYLSASIGAALTGPVGVFIGIGVGIAISVTTFLVHYFSRSKRYKNGIEASMENLKKQLEEYQKTLETDFTDFKESLKNELEIKVEILKKQIDTVDEKKWQEIKDKYQNQKKIINEKIKKNLLNN